MMDVSPTVMQKISSRN